MRRKFELRLSLWWIDRMCINQADTDERNQQVMLMGDIFRNALQVLAWLDEVDEHTAPAFNFIKHVADVSASLDFNAVPPAPSEGAELPDAQIPPLEDPGWAAVDELFTREYFKRAWIFQEIVIARNALLCCGDLHVNWMNLKWLVICRSVLDRDTNAKRDLARYRKEIGSRGVMHMIQAQTFVEMEWQDDDFLKLWVLLGSRRGNQASEDRDRVFSLLKVAIDGSAPALRPDYRKSVREVYASVVLHTIRQEKKLTVLTTVETPKHDRSLPSWVPDWRATFDPIEALSAAIINRPSTDKTYSATGNSEAIVIPTGEEDSQLALRGVCVCRITAISGANLSTIGSDTRYAIDNVLGQDGEWIKLASTTTTRKGERRDMYPHTGESMSTAFARTRVADAWAANNRYARINFSHPHTEIPLPGREELATGQPSNMNGIFARILQTTRYRVLFVTDTKHIGLAPFTARVGDYVYLLLGGEVPYVLRSCPDEEKNSSADGRKHFRYVGECYIHGLMDGEGLVATDAAAAAVRRKRKKEESHPVAEERGRGENEDEEDGLSWLDRLHGLSEVSELPFEMEEVVLI